MALDLSGIANVGEFFSQHYLEQLLERDLKGVLDGWNDAEQAGGPKAPPKRLATLASVYFKQAWQALEDPDPRQRLECAQHFHAHLLEVLGYERSPSALWLDDGSAVPLVASIDHDRLPWLWVVEAPFARSEDDAKPFEEAILPEQLLQAPGERQAANDGGGRAPEVTALRWAELLDGPLFRREHPARWVLFLAGADAFLIDRHKWPQGKYLHFQLGTLLGKRQPAALRAVAALLHRDALLPDGGGSLLDRLDDASHKHAFAVSTDLKWGVERSIEKLGNEVVHYRRSVSKNGLFNGQVEAQELTRECITYLYRLLFLFYVEARGEELGVVPMASDTYRLGYSLETLRDLEQVPLISSAAQEGHFLHESLERLFEIVQKGHSATAQVDDAQTAPPTEPLREDDAANAEPIQGTFALPGLGSPLFDRTHTPLLSGAKLRNSVLQEVLRNLSLSREASGKTRGRISYAQLGINQLGAVYERLLSYTGFFAQEKLYEVRAESEVTDPEARTYFVPERKIGDYKDGEKVRDAQGRPVVHDKGAFLFKLSGRDREKNASYYTPEVLTECLTKYTLKVRLGEPLMPAETPEANDPEAPAPLTADELLAITICEPAMGSGAFLNEAVNQLAHKYLEKKQEELGQTIPADQYQREWAKVKYHFVAHQVYGVDLNPLAADLGKISLWLNALVPDVPPPFLDPRIGVGNSLIGARREVFLAESLTAPGGRTRGGTSWLKSEPLRVPLGPAGFQSRPPGSVYHFLLPDEGFVAYADDKVVKQLQPEAAEALRDWRKALCQPLKPAELERLRALSDRVDALWQEQIADRQRSLQAVRQPCKLWGQRAGEDEGGEQVAWKSVAESDAVYQRLAEPTAAGQRLQAVMDYWCTLWFWPLLEAERAPTREQWLSDVEALLAAGSLVLSAGNKEARERGRVIGEVGARRRFFHWELQFAEVFAERGGLDVFLGNPPWLKVEWQEAGILGDLEPTINLRGLSATQTLKRRAEVLRGSRDALGDYLGELEEAQGIGEYLNATQNYPLLKKTQGNLYKCFFLLSSHNISCAGALGLLHQPGVFDDPKGGKLRKHLYRRLHMTATFKNELVLFPEVDHQRPYAVSVLGSESRGHFFTMGNGFHPSTLEASLLHDGLGPVPAIKTDEGKWDLRGHRSRVVKVDEPTLALFAKLYDVPGTPPSEARLPVVHSQEILDLLRKFAEAPRRLGDLEGDYFCTEHFHETNQQNDGTIRRETRFPKNANEWVLSGPHFQVGTPFNKTPNEGCSSSSDYSPLDLTQIPDDYLPRTNYVPACPPAQYRERTPEWAGDKVTEFYRYVNRTMVAPTGERTLVPAIIPPGPGHLDLVFSISFSTNRHMVAFCGMAASLPVDFFVRSTGKSHARLDVVGQLPLASPPVNELVIHRALRLNCLTTHYADLWQELTTTSSNTDGFAKRDLRLKSWSLLSPRWSRDSALRTPFERRQALVELDALAALSLGLTQEQLLILYRVQFPVLQQYERETFYDQRGKIVSTVNKGLSGVGLKGAAWTEIKDAQAGDRLPEFARDAGGPFVPPFDKCDREADMAEAYQHFRRLLSPGVKKPSHPPQPEKRRAGNGR
jgi:hypothetical protein